MDIRLALMAGTNIPVPECKIVLHQPRIKEIALIGEQTFFVGAQTLCVNKTMFTQDEIVLSEATNFQILMTIMSQKETRDKKNAVEEVFKLVCPEYKMLVTPRAIMLSQENSESVMLDDTNFDIFQGALKEIFCFNSGPMGQEGFNPANEEAARIAQKIMRGQQRVAAEKGSSAASSLSQYLSTLTVGLNSMSLEDCLNLTLYQLYDLVERYSLYINWDIDIRSRLAGGKPDDKPDNWMKNIH